MNANPYAVAAEIISPTGVDYTKDPVQWAGDHGIFLWSKQGEILESVVVEDTAVHSCHNVGKSFDAATAACWWIDSHPLGSAFVVTSAPTGAQVKAILWREIGKIHRRYNMPGRVNLTEWYFGSELVAYGRKPSDYDDDGFQGIHALHVLVILDEACGIPETLWTAATSIASNDNSRILAIGNPDDPQSHFAKVCKPESGWRVIHIGAEDTPNWTGEQVPEHVSQSLISKAWATKRKFEWGETSPSYISKVLGLFPTDVKDGVVPYSWAQRCRTLELSAGGAREGGLDVVGGGGDRAVLWVRQGAVAVRKHEWRGISDSKELAREVLAVIQDEALEALKVDAIGVGWGICGLLDEYHDQGLHHCTVHPVNVSEQADDHDHFLNLRAELWWRAREACNDNAWDLAALDDDDIAELTTPRYHNMNPRRRVQVEKKEEIRKRLEGASPDSADALLLAFHLPVFEAVSHVAEVVEARIPLKL